MSQQAPDNQFYNLPFESKGFDTMPYRTLGRSGLKVSNIGLGTWKMGFPETGDGSRIDEAASLAILDKAAELHVNFWDTANRYNNASGNSERILGTWFHSHPAQRRDIVLCTKLSGLMDGRSPNHCGLSRANILESVYASLERLQTDYIDVLYFHSYDGSTPVEESLLAIEDLVKQDLIRYFAVSNFSVAQLQQYQAVVEQLTPRCRMLAVQNQFDILDGEDEKYRGVMDYAAAQGMSFVAWSPMARGLLSGKYTGAAAAAKGDRLFDEGLAETKITPRALNKLKQLSAIAASAGIELSQLVMAYMLSLPGMGPLIPTSSTVQQLESNAAAGRIILTEQELMNINQILNS